MPDHRIQIELEGLIKLLAQNLYANPDVFLREIIQNAHDAIQKQAYILKSSSDWEIGAAEIRIGVDTKLNTITVSDNGAGLTEKEIHEHLSTIGRSGTRELKDQIIARNRDRTIELIGQFGIGLLSAFIVSSKVDIITKSVSEGGFKWSSSGSSMYSLQPASRSNIGTDVILHVSADNQRYLDLETLRQIIRLYADIIGLPIYLGDETLPANEINAPWHRKFSSTDEKLESYFLYWERRFRKEKSLDVWPIDLTFTYFTGDRDERNGRILGVLGITDRHLPGIDPRGTVDLFISRMFIVSGNREVLPSWAPFIQGVIECSDLTPNAARDDVIRNETLSLVRNTLGREIVEHLLSLARTSRDALTDIMTWHSYQIMAMCLQKENWQFFEEIADIVPLDSDRGPMTIPEYVKRVAKESSSPCTVRYVSQRETASQYYLLCEAKGFAVFNATTIFVEEFLLRYEERWPERVRLRRIDLMGSEEIFEPVSPEELQKYDRIIAELGRLPNVSSQVSRFAPREVPALITEGPSSEARREMEGIASDATMLRSVRDKVRKYLGGTAEAQILHLNADNPTIQRLVMRTDPGDLVGRDALISLYNNAIMLHSKNIVPSNIKIMFHQYNQLVDRLLSESQKAHELEQLCESLRVEGPVPPVGRSVVKGMKPRYVTCFVAMPFTDARAVAVYETLRTVLEDEPFFWHVTRADDRVTGPRLWANVEAMMSLADCFMAEVSDQRPNVMIEVGRMEPYGRPLILLKSTDAPDLPADIKERLFISYPPESKNLAEHLRREIVKYEEFNGLRGEPYLSGTTLRKISGLSETFCDRLAETFETCSELIDADPEATGLRLNCSRLLVEVAQHGIRAVLARSDVPRRDA